MVDKRKFYGIWKGVSNMDQLNSGSNKEPLMMSGPKFGENGGWWAGFKRNRSNIVLSIIGILIIVGGIYLYANYQGPNVSEEQNSQQNQEQVTPDQVNPQGNQSEQVSQPNQPAKLPVSEKAVIVNTSNNQITAKANKGAGVTHLARAAAKQYLANNPSISQSLTPEHKIYIEDYITKKTSTQGLKVDQQLSFSDNLIKDAINHSQQLSQKQLQNLHKYVLLVPSLQS